MEVCLDLSLSQAPKTVSEFMKDVSKEESSTSKLTKIDDFIDRLEEEKRKIEAFKRELPCCMFLLSDVIENLKEEALKIRELSQRQVTTKRKFDEDKGVNMEIDFGVDKQNWMRSVQLWSNRENQNQNHSVSQLRTTIDGDSYMPVETENCNNSKIGGGAVQFKPQVEYQQQRKQRRSWSPELHRRFIEALQKLGGSEVATPKQIRDSMQVDGLTNDEVKSHLQKYRLHKKKFYQSKTEAKSKWTVECLSESSGSPKGPLFANGSKLFSPANNRGDNNNTEENENSDGHSCRKPT